MDSNFSDALPLILLVVVSIIALVIAIVADPVRHENAPVQSGAKPGNRPEGPRVSYLEMPQLPAHLGYWGIQAEAVMSFTVGKTGKATRIRMVRTTHMEIVSCCREAIRAATFLPARNREGEAIEAQMVLPICPAPRVRQGAKRPAPARQRLVNAG